MRNLDAMEKNDPSIKYWSEMRKSISRREFNQLPGTPSNHHAVCDSRGFDDYVSVADGFFLENNFSCDNCIGPGGYLISESN